MMLAFDLFSGAGGAAIGLKRAGFYVIGFDINKPSSYAGDEFVQADIHDLPVKYLREASFVWASPPCQKFSCGTVNRVKETLTDLIPITRDLLKGHPYSCIENVPTAPIYKILELNGLSMGLGHIERRRHFELSFICPQPPTPPLPSEVWDSGHAITVWTGGGCTNALQRERRKKNGLPVHISKEERMSKMGIPLHYKMTGREIGEAVPPAYSEYIGREAMRQIRMDDS